MVSGGGEVGLVMDWLGLDEEGRWVASVWASGSGREDGTGTTADVEASHGRC